MSTRRKNVKKQTKSSISDLNSTNNDFEDENIIFRLPKNSRAENVKTSTRGRSQSQRASSSQSVLSSSNRTSSQPRSQKEKEIVKSDKVHSLSLTKDLSVSTKLNCEKTKVSSITSLNEPSISAQNSPTQSVSDDDEIQILSEDLIDLEKSVCSDSEKLCPACKHIVSVEEYPSHFSTCLQKFCYDKNGKTKHETTSNSNLVTIACPICLKVLPSESEKSTHIKSCGSNHGLSAQQLIEASRLQEKQLGERLALGLPSPQILHENKESKKRRPARKGGLVDRDMELAVALSRSFAEEERNKREREEDKLLSLGLHSLIQEDRRTLALPQPPPLPASGKGSRGAKGRKKPLLTVLMTRTKAERERIMTEKVAALLVGEGTRPGGEGARLPPRPPGPLDRFQDQRSPLWTLSHAGLEAPLDSFFVAALGDFILPQHVPVGGLLKSFSQVPGRHNYTVLAQDSDSDAKSDSDSEDALETTVVDRYCTQLALAEMVGSQDMAQFSIDVEEEEDEEEEEEDDDKDKGEERKEGDEEMEKRKEEVVEGRKEVEGECVGGGEVEESLVEVVTLDSESRSVTPEEGERRGEDPSMDWSLPSLGPSPSPQACLQAPSRTASPAPRHSSSPPHHQSPTHHPSPLHPSPLHQSPLHQTSPLHTSPLHQSPLHTSPLHTSPLHTSPLHTSPFHPQSPLHTSPLNHQSPLHHPSPLHHRSPLLHQTSVLHPQSQSNPPSSPLPPPPPPPPRLLPSGPINPPSSPQPRLASKLVYDWSCLLASGDHSDVIAVTADGEISAHVLVLSVRCPGVLTEIRESSPSLSVSPTSTCRKWIDWSTTAYESCYAFMVYLYSGVCVVESKESGVWLDVFDMAIKYKCTELVAHLEELYRTSEERGKDVPSSSAVPEEVSDAPPLEEEEEEEEEKREEIESEEVVCLDTVSSNVSGHEQQKQESVYGRLTSPDIFGDWDDQEGPRDYIDTPVVTPPGVYHLSERTARLIKTPKGGEGAGSPEHLVLARPNREEEAEGLTTSKSNMSESGLDAASCSSRTDSRRNLSLEFNDLSPSQGKERDPVSPAGGGNKNRNSVSSCASLNLRQSPLSDLNYPSGNEVIDLTHGSDISCEEEEEEEKKKNNKGEEEEEKNKNKGEQEEKKKKKVPSNSPNAKINSVDGKESVDSLDVSSMLPARSSSLSPPPPSFSFLNFEEDRFPSPHSSLLHTPIRDSFGIDRDSMAPETFLGRRGIRGAAPPLVEPSPEKENKGRRLFPVPPPPPPKVLSDPLLLPKNFESMNDDSFLKSVCELEEKGCLKDSSNTKAKGTKLVRSKSCLDYGSSNAFITPDKRGTRVSAVASLKKAFSITPLPDYKAMLSPELKKELDKYGIRKLSRKKAVTLLLHIYEQTHPLVTDSEAETSYAETPVREKPSPPKAQVKLKEKRKVSGKEPISKRLAGGRGKSSEDPLNSSQSSGTSVDSSFECLEETAFPDPEEDDVTPTQQASFESRVTAFIRSDAEIHQQVLLYEPIWANELQQTLKLNGIKCSMGKLIEFLDEQCITFRLPTRERTRKRPRKNSSPGKSPRRKYTKK